MKFIEGIQSSETTLKKNIKESSTRKEKAFYWFTLICRAIFVVILAVILISLSNMAFGEENSAMAVVLFVMLLTLRVINFRYCIKDSLINLAIVLIVLTFMPALSIIVPSGLVFFVHLIALAILLLITCQDPRMGLRRFILFCICLFSR